MIGWGDFYNVMSAMVPLYVAMILAYGSVRWWEIFSAEQCAGINRFVAVFAIPLLSFHFLAANDPYTMNFRFLGADTLQKVVILVGLVLWAHFSRRPGAMDWVITVFAVATLPNTLIMGIPLLDGMYGPDASALMIQIVVLQCIIWYTLLLFLYEYRDAMNLIREQFPDSAAAIASMKVDADVVSLAESEAEARIGYDGKIHVTIRKSTSLRRSARGMTSTPRSPFTPMRSNLASGELYNPNPRLSNYSTGELLPPADIYNSPRTPISPVNREGEPNFRSGNLNQTRQEPYKFARSTSAPPASDLWENEAQELSFAGGKGGARLEEGERLERVSNLGSGLQSGAIHGGPHAGARKQMPPASVLTRIILNMVWRKLIRNPNTYSSIIGLVWSLFEFRFHVQLPKIVANSITILSNTGLGMAMFSLGLFMALQPKLIACGNWMAVLSMAVRFVLGPAVMALVSLAVGLRGDLFRIAVVQAALPQGIVPFVFAKEYNNHATILSTGVIFGLLVALPIDLMYYVLLEL